MKLSRRLLSFLLALAMLLSLTTAFASGEPEEAPAADAAQEAAPEELPAEEVPAADGEPDGPDGPGDLGFTVSMVGPEERTVPLGGSVTLEVDAQAEEGIELTYRWTLFDVSDNFTDLEGETAPTLTLNNIQTGGSYICSVCPVGGHHAISVQYNIHVENHLTVRPAGGNPGASPDPRSATYHISPGDSLELAVAVSADDPSGVTYHWHISHDNSWSYDTLEGETGASLSLTDIREAALYMCNVYDRFGNVENAFFQVVIENGFSAVGPEGSQWNRVSVPYGETAHLTVAVTADDPTGITYQWFGGYDDEVLAGETGPTLDVPNVTGQDFYRCSVTDRFGNCEVVEFNLSIDSGLTVEPIGKTEITVPLHGSARFAVRTNAEDPESITYRWYIEQQDPIYGWTMEPLEGETASVLELADITAGGHYMCSAFDEYGTEETVWFNVEVENGLYAEAPNGQEWMELALPLGGEADLTVTAGAVNAEGITYRWRSEANWQATLGTEPVLHIRNVTQADDYECQVTDCYGNTRYVRFHVAVENGLTAFGPGGRAWENQITAAPGDTVTLPVTATANDPEGITYEWYDITDVEDPEGDRLACTASTLELKNVERSGSYRCFVRDRYGSTVVVEFTVEIENEFTVKAVGSQYPSVPLHGSVTLAVMATAKNGSAFTYEWFTAPRNMEWNTTPVEGGTAPTLALADVTYSGIYICRVTDVYGSTRNVYFYLTIPNDLTLAPADGKDTVIAKDGSAVLRVKATANDPEGIVYQWTRQIYDPSIDGYYMVPLAGDSDTLALTGLTEGGVYRCQATDRFGNMLYVFFTVRMDGKFTAAPAENDGAYHTKLHGSATLKVAAQATDPKKLSYTWYVIDENYDPVLLPGETGASLTVSDVTRYTEYRCDVSDGVGDTVTVLLSVTVDDGFTLEPLGQYVKEYGNPYGEDGSYKTDVYCVYADPGEQVTLAVKAASKAGGLTYTWYRITPVGSIESAESTASSLTVTAQETENYECSVRNSYGEYISLYFRIIVDDGASIPHDEDGDKRVLPNDAALMLDLGGEKTAEAALVLRLLVGLE